MGALEFIWFGRDARLTPPNPWARALLACVDGARDAGYWRVGALVPFLGVHTFCPPHRWVARQQTTELYNIAWAVRMAIRLHRHSITIVSDSEVGIARVLGMRAKSCLQHQQYVLCSIVRIQWVFGLVVRIAWVPSVLRRGDPMSSVQGEYGGSYVRAESASWEVWRQP